MVWGALHLCGIDYVVVHSDPQLLVGVASCIYFYAFHSIEKHADMPAST
jgi:hypothetical protein